MLRVSDPTQAAGTHLTTLLTLMSGLLAVLPVLPTWAPVVVPCVELAVSGGRWVAAAGLLAVHLLVAGYVDDVILSEIQPSSPYLVGFGVAGVLLLLLLLRVGPRPAVVPSSLHIQRLNALTMETPMLADIVLLITIVCLLLPMPADRTLMRHIDATLRA
jgi:hypothetical protein